MDISSKLQLIHEGYTFDQISLNSVPNTTMTKHNEMFFESFVPGVDFITESSIDYITESDTADKKVSRLVQFIEWVKSKILQFIQFIRAKLKMSKKQDSKTNPPSDTTISKQHLGTSNHDIDTSGDTEDVNDSLSSVFKKSSKYVIIPLLKPASKFKVRLYENIGNINDKVLVQDIKNVAGHIMAFVNRIEHGDANLKKEDISNDSLYKHFVQGASIKGGSKISNGNQLISKYLGELKEIELDMSKDYDKVQRIVNLQKPIDDAILMISSYINELDEHAKRLRNTIKNELTVDVRSRQDITIHSILIGTKILRDYTLILMMIFSNVDSLSKMI